MDKWLNRISLSSSGNHTKTKFLLLQMKKLCFHFQDLIYFAVTGN